MYTIEFRFFDWNNWIIMAFESFCDAPSLFLFSLFVYVCSSTGWTADGSEDFFFFFAKLFLFPRQTPWITEMFLNK